MKHMRPGLTPVWENMADNLLDEWMAEVDFVEEELNLFCKMMYNYYRRGNVIVAEGLELIKSDIIEMEAQCLNLKTEMEKLKKELHYLEQEAPGE